MFTSALAPIPVSCSWSRLTYVATFGRTYEFMHAVSARSYSRNSGSTSEESVTGKPG